MIASPCVVKGRRILIVDDIELNRTLTEAVLRGATYDVDSVADGTSALTALETRRYDLVLMDLEMPDLDGHAAASAIRDQSSDVVRLAALSARGDAANLRRSAEVGMTAHIVRPIAPHALLREIERVFCLPLPQAACDPPADPWHRKPYDDWAARLGEERMRGFLLALNGQLRELLRLTCEGGSEARDRLAHDVASTAGMLGFLEVTKRCRAVLEAAGDEPPVAALGAALEAAIGRLDQHFASTTQDVA